MCKANAHSIVLSLRSHKLLIFLSMRNCFNNPNANLKPSIDQNSQIRGVARPLGVCQHTENFQLLRVHEQHSLMWAYKMDRKPYCRDSSPLLDPCSLQSTKTQGFLLESCLQKYRYINLRKKFQFKCCYQIFRNQIHVLCELYILFLKEEVLKIRVHFWP